MKRILTGEKEYLGSYSKDSYPGYPTDKTFLKLVERSTT